MSRDELGRVLISWVRNMPPGEADKVWQTLPADRAQQWRKLRELAAVESLEEKNERLRATEGASFLSDMWDLLSRPTEPPKRG